MVNPDLHSPTYNYFLDEWVWVFGEDTWMGMEEDLDALFTEGKLT